MGRFGHLEMFEDLNEGAEEPRKHNHLVRNVFLNLPSGVSIYGEPEKQSASDGRELPELLKLAN